MTKQPANNSEQSHLLAWDMSYEKEQVDLGSNHGRSRTWTMPVGPFEEGDAHV